MTSAVVSDTSDCFEILGLDAERAEADDVVRERRRLAARYHPDRGGDPSRMVEINAAADQALERIALRTRVGTESDQPTRAPADRGDAGASPSRSSDADRPRVVDRPSFTIDVLPVDAFEGLVLVAPELGEVVDDDPPYVLEMLIRDRGDGHGTWCRLELVPDAGSTTVTLHIETEGLDASPTVSEIRDAWIDGLNRLDWSTGAPAVRPPS